ncbi:hypothetical protein ABIF65_002175 [Bradyrhizobium japonicum]|uniref:Uncharacterized protein n=1 Tax=Bradyrhizobium barranii subsp. barranii TaxID=2823807 RepID=A0A939M6S0_9BRAD|nr:MULTISPECIES: hypothetical protein [Bradyrhizobium]MBR0879341.1 hypothetical protein [Bradyrhizobium liaoningense]MBR1004471.1 hypothetical protein [Bradyrhizobium liaoningense]MBR1069542.1 hypothetical protein [Bradyrhizobium liaoningense]MCP1740673.1 hypothetical protein [Bradyrhizobium japonicum]MCP1779027.1 hypothetical protein [Bradyrhizobium japonicum]
MKKQQAPCNTQNQEQVENYYRGVKAADTAVIRATQGNMLRYHLAKVIETKKGRVYVEQGDPWGGERWYMKSGKSCDHPTGQSNLVVPTPEVLKWIEDHPRGDIKFETDYIYTPPGQRDGDPARYRLSITERMIHDRKKRTEG